VATGWACVGLPIYARQSPPSPRLREKPIGPAQKFSVVFARNSHAALRTHVSIQTPTMSYIGRYTSLYVYYGWCYYINVLTLHMVRCISVYNTLPASLTVYDYCHRYDRVFINNQNLRKPPLFSFLKRVRFARTTHSQYSLAHFCTQNNIDITRYRNTSFTRAPLPIIGRQ